MFWTLVALGVVAASMAAVFVAISRVRDLVPRTLEALDLLGRDLQPAVVRVRDAAEEARARRAPQ